MTRTPAPKIVTFWANAGVTGANNSEPIPQPTPSGNACVSKDSEDAGPTANSFNSVVLSWNLENSSPSTSCTVSIDQGIGLLPTNLVPTGTLTYYDLTQSTLFTMNAVNEGGVAAPRTLFVNVAPKTSGPSILSFTASSTSIQAGSSVTLQWQITDTVTSLWLGSFRDYVDLSNLGGIQSFSPLTYTNLSYLLCSGTNSYNTPPIEFSTQFVLFANDNVGPYVWFPNTGTQGEQNVTYVQVL